MNKKSRYKRGHAVGLLISIEKNYSIFWEIYSCVIKQSNRIKFEGNRLNEKDLYNFHENLIIKIKSIIKNSIISIIITSPIRTKYNKDFFNHIKKHHKYFFSTNNSQIIKFELIAGEANDIKQATNLIKTDEYKKAIRKIISDEADVIDKKIEKIFFKNNNLEFIKYSLNEIENEIYRENKKNVKKKYLLLTNLFLKNSNKNQRIQRLMQISKNNKIITKVINSKTSAGIRIDKLGGMVFFIQE